MLRDRVLRRYSYSSSFSSSSSIRGIFEYEDDDEEEDDSVAAEPLRVARGFAAVFFLFVQNFGNFALRLP